MIRSKGGKEEKRHNKLKVNLGRLALLLLPPTVIQPGGGRQRKDNTGEELPDYDEFFGL